MGNIEDQIEEINGFKVLATEVEVSNAKEIRQTWMISNLNNKMYYNLSK